MKSIHRRLLTCLLGGVLVLISVAGSTIYYVVRQQSYARVDEELKEARKVIFNVFESGRLHPGSFLEEGGRRSRFRDEERWRQFDAKNGELLYQLRHSDGEILLRSPSLGQRNIERPEVLSDPRKSVLLSLTDGTQLSARIDEASPNRWPEQFHSLSSNRESSIEIIVARDLTSMRKELSLLLAGIWSGGLLACVATGLLVSLVIRWGLSPLNRLGIEASRVDSNTLNTRFTSDQMPIELIPICDRLNSLMSRLENSFERERRFSSDLAHELRTPIAEISSMTEAGLLFPDKPVPGRLEKIHQTSHEMQGIVESLLTLARCEQGAQTAFEEVEMTAMIRECWNSYSEASKNRDQAVELRIRSDLSFSTDPELIRLIIKNLISNAVEYTPRGGKIRIELSTPDLPSSWLVAVSNTPGIEVDPANLPRFFERFWRGDPSRKRSGHSGLGLALARACSEALGLELRATLENGLIRFELSREQNPGRV